MWTPQQQEVIDEILERIDEVEDRLDVLDDPFKPKPKPPGWIRNFFGWRTP